MEILLAILACCGAFWMLAALWGLLLRGYDGETALLLRLRGDAPELEKRVRRAKWLQSMEGGELPVLLLDCGLSPQARRRAEKLAQGEMNLHLLAEKDLLTYFDFTRADHGTGI